MAGDWIKIESATPEKPEVLKLARILSVPRLTAVGAVVAFWSWLDRMAVDGTVSGITSADVDATLGMPGFCSAMQEVGWLRIEDDRERLAIPHWDRLNGAGAKIRALANSRQAKWRAAKPAKPRANGHDPDPGFAAFWAAYPRREARPAAERAWAKLAPDDALQARILAAIGIQCESGCLRPGVSADGRSLVPHPGSYLNGRRWEDEAQSAPIPSDMRPAKPAEQTPEQRAGNCAECGKSLLSGSWTMRQNRRVHDHCFGAKERIATQ